MHFEPVLVQNETDTVVGSSGVMVNEKFVVTTSNVLLKYVLDDHPNLFTKFKPGKLNEFEDRSGISLTVVWKKSTGLFNVRPARISGLAICENIKNLNSEVFRDWAFDSIENNRNLRDALSTFFVLKIQEQANLEEFENVLKVWYENIAMLELEQGRELLCRTTPFGNRFFLDTHCKGIVGNVIGDNSCLILSDCPTTPGSEGAPVYLPEGNNFPVGLVILSVQWWKGEWVGLTLIADLRSLISQLIQVTVNYTGKESKIFVENVCSKVEVPANYSVVQIYSGNSWGTAILISKENGIFITNSHVIENSLDIRLYWRNLSAKGNLVYKTPEVSTFDLAVLECKSQDFLKNLSPCKLPVDSKPKYNSGDTVYCVGHALLPRAAGASPTISRGHVTDAGAHLLRTTCSVHPGASGGGIFDAGGRLIGVVVSNAKLRASGAVYPRLNAAVPVAAVAGVLGDFVRTGDKSILDNLQTNNLEAKMMWNGLSSKL